MPQHFELSRDLRQWWSQQSRYARLKQFADDVGIPYSSLKKYFAGSLMPTRNNRALLFEATHVEILGPGKTIHAATPTPFTRISDRPSRQPITGRAYPKLDKKLGRRLQFTSATLSKLSEHLLKSIVAVHALANSLHDAKNSPDSQIWSQQARAVQSLLDALERILRSFLESQQSIEVLRAQLSGPDVGYISGLLAALFDDKRLANWKAMTTYVYGAARHGR